jgi:hypothetical protein
MWVGSRRKGYCGAVVCFGSEADISQGWLEIRALGSAYGQQQTLAMQKKPLKGEVLILIY